MTSSYWRVLEKYAVYFLSIDLALVPARSPEHVFYVRPMFPVLGFLIKQVLPVKHMFLLSVYFLAATRYKRHALYNTVYVKYET